MEEKQLIVIGDRLLIKLDDDEKRTEVGLYLPASVQSKEEVVGGEVIQVGQGTPLVDPSTLLDSPWGSQEIQVKYIPMQAKVGDYALFLKKAGIEIQFEHNPYTIVSQNAVLALVREKPEPYSMEVDQVQ